MRHPSGFALRVQICSRIAAAASSSGITYRDSGQIPYLVGKWRLTASYSTPKAIRHVGHPGILNCVIGYSNCTRSTTSARPEPRDKPKS